MDEYQIVSDKQKSVQLRIDANARYVLTNDTRENPL